MEKELTQYLTDMLEKEEIQGMGILIRKNGEILYHKNVGFSDIDKNKPSTDQTLYPICSMTKLIVAVAVMQFVEQHKISLDDSIRKYFTNYPKEKEKITIRHLLNHCSGLGQAEKSMRYYTDSYDESDNLKERTEKWAGMPFDFKPGESALYSPLVNFDLLGRILEIVSGQELPECLASNILIPLKMNDTVFCLSEEQKSRCSEVFKRENEHIRLADELMQGIDGNKGYYSGSAGLYSTLRDYDRFTTMLARNGKLDGVSIIQQDTLQLMTTVNQIAEIEMRAGCPWGLGFMVFEHPERAGISVGHGTFGWSGAYGTHMYVDPETRISLTMMMARVDIGGARSYIARDIERIVMDKLSK